MNMEDRAKKVCQVWHQRGIQNGHYLSDILYHQLDYHHRGQLHREALSHLKNTSANFHHFPSFSPQRRWLLRD